MWFHVSLYKKSWMISNNSQTHPDESQLKMCHLCTFKTLKDKALFYHIEVKHEKKTRFNCPSCDRQFYFEHQMKRHIKSTYILVLTRLTWLIHTSVLPSIWNPGKIFAPIGQLGQAHMVKKIFLIFLHAGRWSFLLLNFWFSSKLVSKMN